MTLWIHRFMATAVLTLLLSPTLGVWAEPKAVDLRKELPDTSLDATRAISSNSLEAAQVAMPAKRPYLLGPNDSIELIFFAVPELNQKELRISPDGSIMLPALGRINCNGKTLDELKDIIQIKMARYLRDPRVSINLTSTKPLVISVLGAVRRIGNYEFNTNPSRAQLQPNASEEFLKIERTSPTLVNAIIAAGGLDYDANMEHVTIINNFSGEHYKVNLLPLIMGIQQHPDIWLTYGDSIHIERLSSPLAVNPAHFKALARTTYFSDTMPVRVYGYVAKPGLIQLDTSRNVDINSAIALAGGFDGDFAYSPSKVIIARKDEHGRLATRIINPREEDSTVLPGDIIYVPDKPLSKVVRGFRILGNIVSPVSTVAGSYNSWALLFDPTRNFRR
jgi:protein involved in polysaccharide export with SLBB domain